MGQSRFRKQGGGFLNGVDGRITDYEFTDKFNGEDFVPGKVNGKDKFYSLFCVLSVRVDGADEDVTTTLFTGGADDFEVSEDGHVLTPNQDGYQLGAGTPFAKLVQSMEKAGHPGTQTDDEAVIDFTPIIGKRYRFVQQELSEKELAELRRKGKPTTRKGKDGKEYKLQNLVVDTVYDNEPDTAPAAPKAKDGKKSAKGAKAPVANIAEIATAAITRLVTKPLTKNKLGTLVLQDMMKDENRDKVRTWLFEDANLEALAEADVILSYDRKTGQIVPNPAE
jgi:hypothetical protein